MISFSVQFPSHIARSQHFGWWARCSFFKWNNCFIVNGFTDDFGPTMGNSWFSVETYSYQTNYFNGEFQNFNGFPLRVANAYRAKHLNFDQTGFRGCYAVFTTSILFRKILNESEEIFNNPVSDKLRSWTLQAPFAEWKWEMLNCRACCFSFNTLHSNVAFQRIYCKTDHRPFVIFKTFIWFILERFSCPRNIYACAMYFASESRPRNSLAI